MAPYSLNNIAPETVAPENITSKQVAQEHADSSIAITRSPCQSADAKSLITITTDATASTPFWLEKERFHRTFRPYQEDVTTRFSYTYCPQGAQEQSQDQACNPWHQWLLSFSGIDELFFRPGDKLSFIRADGLSGSRADGQQITVDFSTLLRDTTVKLNGRNITFQQSTWRCRIRQRQLTKAITAATKNSFLRSFFYSKPRITPYHRCGGPVKGRRVKKPEVQKVESQTQAERLLFEELLPEAPMYQQFIRLRSLKQSIFVQHEGLRQQGEAINREVECLQQNYEEAKFRLPPMIPRTKSQEEELECEALKPKESRFRQMNIQLLDGREPPIQLPEVTEPETTQPSKRVYLDAEALETLHMIFQEVNEWELADQQRCLEEAQRLKAEGTQHEGPKTRILKFQRLSNRQAGINVEVTKAEGSVSYLSAVRASLDSEHFAPVASTSTASATPKEPAHQTPAQEALLTESPAPDSSAQEAPATCTEEQSPESTPASSTPGSNTQQLKVKRSNNQKPKNPQSHPEIVQKPKFQTTKPKTQAEPSKAAQVKPKKLTVQELVTQRMDQLQQPEPQSAQPMKLKQVVTNSRGKTVRKLIFERPKTSDPEAQRTQPQIVPEVLLAQQQWIGVERISHKEQVELQQQATDLFRESLDGQDDQQARELARILKVVNTPRDDKDYDKNMCDVKTSLAKVKDDTKESVQKTGIRELVNNVNDTNTIQTAPKTEIRELVEQKLDQLNQMDPKLQYMHQVQSLQMAKTKYRVLLGKHEPRASQTEDERALLHIIKLLETPPSAVNWSTKRSEGTSKLAEFLVKQAEEDGSDRREEADSTGKILEENTKLDALEETQQPNLQTAPEFPSPKHQQLNPEGQKAREESKGNTELEGPEENQQSGVQPAPGESPPKPQQLEPEEKEAQESIGNIKENPKLEEAEETQPSKTQTAPAIAALNFQQLFPRVEEVEREMDPTLGLAQKAESLLQRKLRERERRDPRAPETQFERDLKLCIKNLSTPADGYNDFENNKAPGIAMWGVLATLHYNSKTCDGIECGACEFQKGIEIGTGPLNLQNLQTTAAKLCQTKPTPRLLEHQDSVRLLIECSEKLLAKARQRRTNSQNRPTNFEKDVKRVIKLLRTPMEYQHLREWQRDAKEAKEKLTVLVQKHKQWCDGVGCGFCDQE